MWYTPYLFQPQGSYSFGRTPSLGCQASGPSVPSDGCEMLARARERVSADDEWGAGAAPRHPPTPSKVATGSNFGLLGQFCPQTTTSPPTLSGGLLQLAALALLGMSGFVPISPNGNLASYDRGKEPPEACAANTAQLAQSSRQSRLASNPLLLLKASFSPQSPPPLGALVSHSGSLAPQKSNSSASRARRMLIRTSCLFRPLRPPDLPAEGTAATPKIYFSKSNQTWRKPGKMETPMNGSPAPFLELIITQCPIASPVAGRTSSAC